MKTIIYDFDGTLTKSQMPNYAIIKKCGIKNLQELNKLIKSQMKLEKLDIYNAFYKLIFNLLKNNSLELTVENFCFGSKEIEYNLGVVDFLKENNDINHYIVTSGYDEYVKHTVVAPYIKQVFGTTCLTKDNIIVGLQELMTDQKKVDKISLIANNSYNNLIYVGDGLTDKYAFKHVLENGGDAILVCQDDKDDSIYNNLISEGINVKKFIADYRKGSELYKYLIK